MRCAVVEVVVVGGKSSGRSGKRCVCVRECACLCECYVCVCARDVGKLEMDKPIYLSLLAPSSFGYRRERASKSAW